MKQSGLEQKITGVSSNGRTNLFTAKNIMRQAAKLPLIDYLEGDTEVYKYILEELRINRNRKKLTYSQACRKFVEYNQDEKISDSRLILAFASVYVKESEDEW